MKKITLLLLILPLLLGCPGPSKPTKEEITALEKRSKLVELTLRNDRFSEKYNQSLFDLDSLKDLYYADPQNPDLFIDIDSIINLREEFIVDSLRNNLLVQKKTLEKKFISNVDDFQGVTFYRHKHWGKHTPNRKTLTASVSSQGAVFFRSNYYAQDWIFHTSILVLIDDVSYSSEVIETFSDRNKRDNSGGNIWEVITYRNNDLLNLIAKNSKKEIRVRFRGKYYSDITLSFADKKALKDCYELGMVLRKMSQFN